MVEGNDASEFREKWIEPTWKKLTREISYWTYNMALPVSAEDIAAESIIYAIAPRVDHKVELPTSEKHLLRRARMIARWKIHQAVHKASKMSGRESLDCTPENEDGITSGHSAAEVEYVMHSYYARKRHNEMLASGRLAFRRLDAFLAGHGVSGRDIEIYKARGLHQASTDRVCARYGITRDNLYRIVCIINGILSRCGRSLVGDQL